MHKPDRMLVQIASHGHSRTSDFRDISLVMSQAGAVFVSEGMRADILGPAAQKFEELCGGWKGAGPKPIQTYSLPVDNNGKSQLARALCDTLLDDRMTVIGYSMHDVSVQQNGKKVSYAVTNDDYKTRTPDGEIVSHVNHADHDHQRRQSRPQAGTQPRR